VWLARWVLDERFNVMICVRAAASLLPVCFIISGCHYNVTLAVKNSVSTPAPPPLNITAIAKDSNGQQSGTTGFGTVNPGAVSTPQTFSVKKGGSYSVQGNLSSGVTAYTSGDKTVNGNLANESVDITTLTSPTINPNDVSAIQAAFGQLGANVGFNPVTVPSALGSLFGGLVWYVDTNNPLRADTQLIMVISPSQLTGAVALADFQYPQGPQATHDDTISSSASLQVSGSVPLWGNLSGGFAANSLYKTHWSMVGFGNVTKSDTVSFQDKLNALTAAQKTDICNRLTTANSHVMYVNEMYVIKSAILSYQKGNTVTSSAAISGASIIAGNAAYDFSSSQIETTEIDDTVVNVEGPTFSKSTVSFCAAAAPAPAITAQALVHLSDAKAALLDSSGGKLALTNPTLKKSARAPQ
jgi:hypothetical protein